MATSNTSIGRGKKGSKFWMQTLVNFCHGESLNREIRKADPSFGKIRWLSPLKADHYRELRIKEIVAKIPSLAGVDLSLGGPGTVVGRRRCG